MPRVTVIVPVYNTQDYLEQCISSIAGQSHTELEIIIVNDGSTDGSGSICRKWAAADKRILLVEKENGGQGAARNLAIDMASGEFIIFVDSDDYVGPQLVESALGHITAMHADICIFDYYNVTEEKSTYISSIVKLASAAPVSRQRELLRYLNPVLWNKMYRAHLVKSSNCSMTNNICEDLALLPLLLVNAESVCTLSGAYYYYRYNRLGNLSTNANRYGEIMQSVLDLKAAFAHRQLFHEYQRELYYISYNIFKDIVTRIGKRDDLHIPADIRSLYRQYLQEYEECLQREYSDILYGPLLCSNYIGVGSYNLRVVIRELLLEDMHFVDYYGAASLVSLMCHKGYTPGQQHVDAKNEYRKMQVERDIQKQFSKDFSDSSKIAAVDYVVVDFLEEISDVYYREEMAVTKSPFFDEVYGSIPMEAERLSILDAKRTSLWREKCLAFVQKLRESGKTVVLVENLLSERHSPFYDSFEPFLNADWIRAVNAVLEDYYAFFCENMQEAIRVVPRAELRFTENEFPFGCEPIYYNKGYYRDVALQIHGACKAAAR